MDKVGIFRLDLFKLSETFITRQVAALETFSPVFLGRALAGPPGEAAYSILSSKKLAHAQFIVGRDASAFARQVRSQGIGLIHAHFATDGSAALPLARALRIPLIVTLHGFDVTVSDLAIIKSRQPTLVQARLHRRALQRHAACFICVSEHIRNMAIHKGYPSDKLIVLPIGSTIPDCSEPEQGDDLIVHVCRLVEKKGTAYLIDAMAVLSQVRPSARLVIVGDGPLLPELKARAKTIGVANKVTFLGAQPHPTTLEWIAKANVVCVPSITAQNGDTEGLPTILFEAASRSVAVVATLNSGIPEAVEDNVTGLLVAERDSVALAMALEKILASRSLQMEMGKAARTMMIEKFDIISQTRKLENIYRSLI